ncbi:MAG: PEP-CTERM sorting domain-containing protein [Sedimentisphaerales bacterium]|nr:PEP-CTERM sorting domain-containing protein [Sedimentisphaerales bacterium]
MKKLSILYLVISMAASALAVPYFRVDPADIKDHYAPSEIITIQLVDNDLLGFSIDAITDGGVGGMAAEPQTFHSNFIATKSGDLNVNGHLVEYIYGSGAMLGTSGILYTFEYHMPDVPVSTIIEIGSFADGDLYWEPAFDYGDGSFYEGPISPAVIHIPEPATLAILGFGALMLRRRK